MKISVQRKLFINPALFVFSGMTETWASHPFKLKIIFFFKKARYPKNKDAPNDTMFSFSSLAWAASLYTGTVKLDL